LKSEGGKKEVEKVRRWEGIGVESGNAEVGIEGHSAEGMGQSAEDPTSLFELRRGTRREA
jgi:hypothetical protein